jgi:hypothetical protein
MRGRKRVRMTTIITRPDRNGNTRSFLFSIRIFQLVFTSSMLLPVLSNTGSERGVNRDEGF